MYDLNSVGTESRDEERNTLPMTTGEKMDRPFKGVAYLRVSRGMREGADESNSIENQRRILNEFLEINTDITLMQIRVDDGFTGADFERPGFQQMLLDLKDGANCILVKDLSRLGRNYIGCGKYVERQFKQAGIRFISIADQIDTFHEQNSAGMLMMPMKNLMNEMLIAGLSASIRSHLDARRADGMFTGAFVSYGYKKDPKERGKLTVDLPAAEIVRKVFWLRLHGMTMMGIADYLNCFSVPTPLDYKHSMGIQFKTSFQIYRRGIWGANTVKRILNNKIYIGRLEQKRTSTADYKHRKRISLPEEKWICIEKSHEAAISEDVFRTLSRIGASSGDMTLLPRDRALLGMARCGYCGSAMSLQTVPHKETKYRYYVCNHCCEAGGNTRVRAETLENWVLSKLNEHILRYLPTAAFQAEKEAERDELSAITKQIGILEMQRETWQELMRGMQIDCEREILSDNGLKDMAEACAKEISALEKKEAFLKYAIYFIAEQEPFYAGGIGCSYLSHAAVMSFVKEIAVNSKVKFSITFNEIENPTNFLHI